MRSKSIEKSRLCLHCGEPFNVPRFNQKQQWCSRLCSARASGLAKKRSPEERFWEKVDKNGPVPEHCPEIGPCWIWTAFIPKKGYPTIGIPPGKIIPTHRFSYEQAYGPAPDGLWVLHRCDNRACVRPDHLFLGTAKDNTQDALSKGRMSSGDKHYMRQRPELIRRGEQLHNSKLTAEQVLAIRALAGKKRQRDIAAEFGVSHDLISHIITRRTWKHV